MVMSGGLQVVKVAERTEPCTGLYWDVLAELGPGDWFGEGSLLTGAPRSATVVASAPCELVELPKSACERSLRSNPHLVEHLADLMASRAAHAAEAPRAAHRREAWMAEIRHWFRI
ncbi:MAG: cyclic nucleotide-binding domain-containing protein [Holophaga sp.]|jgi:CRP-like cAMP-binding protein